ncbi:unnamed protein product [Echinostoma caproni]|uniref:HORMA domain-containing protein n=1 Tax=Echinostoma caproni TaxID=27848 RepID=A0A183A0I2_9TREM|nr:unnamed protein product [Echinostoma caproni]
MQTDLVITIKRQESVALLGKCDFIRIISTFELLIYTDRNTPIPEGWDESGPQFINNSAEIKMRSFSTTVHRVDHVISYKLTS